MNNTVIACVDGSPSTRPVCEYAAWAAGKLGAPLALLHVLEKSETPAVSDLTGSIGIDSREQLTVIEKTYRQQLEAIAEAAELGVMLGVGTDAGSPGVSHGAGYLQELRLYRRAGLEPAAILAAATVAGAKIAGARQRAGPVEEGRPAGLIAVKGNPLEDLDVLGEIEYVILPGSE